MLPHIAIGSKPNNVLTPDYGWIQINDGSETPRTMRTEIGDGQTVGLDVGEPIRVSLGTGTDQRVVFDGSISTVNFVFEEIAPPTVVVSADAVASSPREPAITSYTLVRGRELLTARAMVRKGLDFVTVFGATTGWPDVVVGSILRLEHIGASFSGDGYRVTRLNHTFDLEHGLRSSFVAQRAI